MAGVIGGVALVAAIVAGTLYKSSEAEMQLEETNRLEEGEGCGCRLQTNERQRL